MGNTLQPEVLSRLDSLGYTGLFFDRVKVLEDTDAGIGVISLVRWGDKATLDESTTVRHPEIRNDAVGVMEMEEDGVSYSLNIINLGSYWNQNPFSVIHYKGLIIIGLPHKTITNADGGRTRSGQVLMYRLVAGKYTVAYNVIDPAGINGHRLGHTLSIVDGNLVMHAIAVHRLTLPLTNLQ